jgi:hypothetical protein
MIQRAGLKVLAAAMLAAALGPSAWSGERAVGLEARGVDPSAALHNPAGLDVRDALGRPVSARVIESQLKAARAEASAEAAFSSRLPQARAMARALEYWEGLKVAFGTPSPILPWSELWALPGPKSASKAGLPLMVVLAAILLSHGSVRCRSLFLPRASSGAPLVLRC